MDKKKIVVGISTGDLNGIGIEVILKTFKDTRMMEFCTPVIFGSTKVVSYHKKALDLDINIHGIHSLDKVVHGKLNVLNIWKDEISIELGTATKIAGQYAAESLEKSAEALQNDEIDFLLTAPINKDTIQSEAFNFAGHTEFLQDRLEGESLMILLNQDIRIGLITGHIPLSEVASKINQDLITKKVDIMYHSLKKDFQISKPKIAVLSLNPHAGDNGLLGTEETEIIKPAIESIKETGKLVFGPYAADGFFGSKNYLNFDGVLAMYHDQGLAPFKTLAFGSGVNFTAGLNKIRTSPDHGTAFEIAGKNKANIESFKEALFTGIQLFRNRNNFEELSKNPLELKS